MSDHDGRQLTALQRPANNNPEAWRAYWQAQGQSWRTEPEINTERKKYLAERQSITPDIGNGIYPFKDIEPRLSRADVEWLLAMHENGRGPIDWKDPTQRVRVGLDLRGADLHHLDLSGLPLAGMHGSLDANEWRRTTIRPSIMAEINLEGAFLNGVHLEGAYLRRAHMERTELYGAYLEKADLLLAQLEGAFLYETHLEGTNLRRANLETVNLGRAHLEGCNLCLASFNSKTILENISLGNDTFGFASVADVNWNAVNLAVVKWSNMKILGDEIVASQKSDSEGKTKDKQTRLSEYEAAVRANRQLAAALRDQGLNEVADRFAYRAYKLQRMVFWYQSKFGQYLGSLFLYLLAGYGYRPARSVAWYVIIICGFALTYFEFGHFPPLEAFVFSLTSFHGRGFFPSNNISLSDPRVILAAFEAVVGLLIEISFIATFTQRFFGK